MSKMDDMHAMLHVVRRQLPGRYRPLLDSLVAMSAPSKGALRQRRYVSQKPPDIPSANDAVLDTKNRQQMTSANDAAHSPPDRDRKVSPEKQSENKPRSESSPPSSPLLTAEPNGFAMAGERHESASANDAVATLKKRARVTWRRFPSDYVPSDADLAFAVELGADLQLELAKLRDHEFAKPRSDAAATLRNWLRNSVQFGGGRTGTRPKGAALPLRAEDFPADHDDFDLLEREAAARTNGRA